jgi:uncharacterized membrane protein YphA (DoxX/SURF4 family)
MSWFGQNVDLGWSATLIRLATGAFFLPHAYVKPPWPGTIAFFQAAGFKPPVFWMYVASAIRAASGQTSRGAATAPPSSVMTSRRLTGAPFKAGAHPTTSLGLVIVHHIKSEQR